MEPLPSLPLLQAPGPRYTISIKRLVSKRQSTVSCFPAYITVTPGKRIIRVRKLSSSESTSFEYFHHPATTFFRHRHHHRNHRVSAIITLPPSNVWWRTSSRIVSPLIPLRGGRQPARYAYFKPFKINYVLLKVELDTIHRARKFDFLHLPITRSISSIPFEIFTMVGKKDEKSRGTPSSKAYMSPHARGEGGPGNTMPEDEQQSPSKNRAVRSRLGYNRPPTRHSRPPTRQERPQSRQQENLHSKVDKALLLPRKELDSLLTGAKKKADPNQKPPPKTPDLGLRPQSRFGQTEATPSMIPGPKNSSRSEQFLNSTFGGLPRPDRSKNTPSRMDTPTYGSLFTSPFSGANDDSNIDGATDVESTASQLESLSSEGLEEDLASLRISFETSHQHRKQTGGSKKFQHLGQEADEDTNNEQPLPQASQYTNPFGDEEKTSGKPSETKPLTYETRIYNNYGFVFAIENEGAKVANDKLMDNIKFSPLTKKLAAEATGKWKAWADDPYTPIQTEALHLPYAFRMMMRKAMLSTEGEIRPWNEKSRDFGDLLSLLSSLSDEYKYRRSISDSFAREVAGEIERYLAIFFEYEDENTRVLIYRRFLRDGLAARKKAWCKGFDQSRKIPVNNFHVPGGARSLTFYCGGFNPLRSAVVWAYPSPMGGTYHQVADDFEAGVDGKITMIKRIEEKPYEFAMPPLPQVPPRTPPKGVPFRAGYKFDGSFFDAKGDFAIPLAIFDVIDIKVDRPKKRYDDESLLIIDGSFSRAMGHYIRASVDVIITVVSKMPGANIQLKVIHGEQIAEGLIRKLKSVLTNSKKNVILQDQITALSEVSIFNSFWKTMCMVHEACSAGRDCEEHMLTLQSNLQEQVSRVYGELSFKQLVVIRPDSQVRIIEYSADLENSRCLDKTTLEFDSRGEVVEEESDEENDSGN
ncbi:hypothetical protein TWF506_008051 [Arthrobotrys conoides]|uniref:Uncharacterized protein n=1 Tax=Arthrobotrys conoides TaxID=74498 RepID=A0AAN8NNN5_9PEZI